MEAIKEIIFQSKTLDSATPYPIIPSSALYFVVHHKVSASQKSITFRRNITKFYTHIQTITNLTFFSHSGYAIAGRIRLAAI